MKSLLLKSLVVAFALIGMSACSSSKTATPASSPDTSSAGTNGAETLPGGTNASGDSTDASGPITVVGTDKEVRAQIVKEVLAFGSQASYAFDAACVTATIAKLSAADLEAFRVSFSDPVLSAEGEAIGSQILECDPSRTSNS